LFEPFGKQGFIKWLLCEAIQYITVAYTATFDLFREVASTTLKLHDFMDFCNTCYADTQALVREYQDMQENRERKKGLGVEAKNSSGPAFS